MCASGYKKMTEEVLIEDRRSPYGVQNHGSTPGAEDGEDADSEKELLLPPDAPPSPRHGARGGINLFLAVLTSVSALGGFLFGYDTGVVSGAMILISEHFGLDSTWHEVIVSATLAAAAVAAALGGPLSDILGRRPTLIIASLVFTVGAVVMGAAIDRWMLLAGRVVVGLGVGLAAMAVPMYIAESAPAGIRGKLVVVNNLMITGGQFVATVVDGVFSYLPRSIGWRFMLGLAGIPSLIMFVGFLFMPETPRWLVYHGKTDQARRTLAKVRAPGEVEEELSSIVADYNDYKQAKLGWRELAVRFLTSRPVLLALLVGCGLQLFQQFGGINTVMYYSASIIQMAGFSDRDAIWLATIPSFGNFIFTIVGLLLVDRIGRRKLLIGSISGVVVMFLLLSGTFVLMDSLSPSATPLFRNGSCDFDSCGACVGNSKCGFCVDHDPESGHYYNGTCSLGGMELSHNGVEYYSYYRPVYAYNDTVNVTVDCGVRHDVTRGVSTIDLDFDREWYFTNCPDNQLAPLAIVALFLYIAFFAPGMGPLPWTVNSEIYPTWARSTAIAIATSVNWISNLIVSMTFLSLADGIGQPGTFGLYAGLGLLGFLFIVFMVPETKGRSLEDMEQLFQVPYFVRWCQRQSKGRRESSED